MEGKEGPARPGLASAQRAEAARQHLAGERERLANDRETAADERERHANARQAAADEREHDIDARARQAGLSVETLHQRTLEAVDRARTLLALSAERLDRQEALVQRWLDTDSRGEAGHAREQAEVDRASASADRAMAAMPPDPSRPLERATASRIRAVKAIDDLAINQDEAARAYEELAAIAPDRRVEYQAAADHAREAAQRAREALRALTG
jgi:hypothetical protein